MRPRAPISLRSCSFTMSRSSAFASSPSFFGLTSSPSTPFESTRLNPSMRDAAIGLPAAIASSSTMPKLSRPVFGAQ